MKQISNFSELALPPILLETLVGMEFTTPTPIQAQAIPPGLEGRDVLAIAPTGTGKTGAFGIPALTALYHQPGKQVLILAPTRELAAQIARFMRQIAEPMDMVGTLIVGGESFPRQRTQVKRGVDYIVATPGRLNDHIEQGMPLENISMLVLDEVDRMLDMGFAPQVEDIVKNLPPERQTFFFSATMPKEIVKLADRYLKNPVRVKVEAAPHEKPLIDEMRIDTTDPEKPALLLKQISEREGKILVFANTQGRVEQVTRRLEHAGTPAASIHGGRTHRERKFALEAFRRGDVRVLVATDIVARGIDVPDVEHVINYDLPASEEDHTHRIGRTGRIGKKGSAVTFVDEFRLRKQRGGKGRGGPVRGGGRPQRGGGRPSPGRSPGSKPRFAAAKPFTPRPPMTGMEAAETAHTPVAASAPASAPAPRKEGFKKPFNDGPREGGFKKRFEGPREGGFKKRFNDGPREGGGFRKPFHDGPREGGFRKSFDGPRDSGFKKRFNDGPREGGGFRKPFHDGPREGFKPRTGGGLRKFEGGDRPAGGGHRGFKKAFGFGGEGSDSDSRPRRTGGFKPQGGRPPFQKRFDDGGERRGNPHVFRAGEEKPHTPKAGPRKFVHDKPKAKRPLSPNGFKPWVRGKQGAAVRRGKSE